MMKLLSVIPLVLVVIAATVVMTKHSDDILAPFTSWTDSSAQVPGLAACPNCGAEWEGWSMPVEEVRRA